MSRPFVLVLQFRELEESVREAVSADLVRELGRCGEDLEVLECYGGEAWGAGTVEFYLHTADPEVTLERVLPKLGKESRKELLVAACRHDGEGSFVVLWPESYPGDWHLPDLGDEEDVLEYAEELQGDDEEEEEDDPQRFLSGDLSSPIEPT